MRKIPITGNMTPIDKKCVDAGITRRELAQMSGIPYVTIDQWARRKRLPRDVYQLYKVAQALGCSIEDIMEPEPQEDGQPEAQDTPAPEAQQESPEG